MPKKCIKFIPEYLIPNLNNETFGEGLKWINKSKRIFEIDWCHKSGSQWTEKEAAVFVEWDKHKGHFNPENKQYYSQSKQRFRALLYKLSRDEQLIEMKSEKKFKRVYCINQKKKSRKRKTDSSAQYESCYTEEISSEEQDSEDIHAWRTASENDAINVLEDHSYTVHGDVNNFSGVFAHNTENALMLQSNMQDLQALTLSSEPDIFQKRVLMDCTGYNHTQQHMSVPVGTFNVCLDSHLLFDLRDEIENTNVSMPNGKIEDFYYQVYQSTPIIADLSMKNAQEWAVFEDLANEK